MGQLLELCGCSSYGQPAESDAHTVMEPFQNAAMGRKSCKLLSEPLQHFRGAETVYVCMCTQVCVHVHPYLCVLS